MIQAMIWAVVKLSCIKHFCFVKMSKIIKVGKKCEKLPLLMALFTNFKMRLSTSDLFLLLS